MAQTPAPRRVAIRCGRLIDGKSATARTNAIILIEGERIREVGSGLAIPAGAEVIDLSHSTVLPGLIDNHTHILLGGDITAADYDEQLLKESIPFRAIRATGHVRTALLHGFTTMRDLETEGAMYADVDVKTAINRGIIPGPRMFVATRSFAPTGMYPLLGYSWELRMPEGVQVVDGPDNIRRAVREQVKYGADWIKYYSDRKYFLKDGALHSWVNFTDDEAKAMVEETHRLGHKVAAHAMGREGIESALRAGVDTIEHGDGLDDETMDLMIRRGVYWCPTIYVGVYVAEGRAGS
jgi:imidazolonepropionase-like amidohydrolase